MNLRFLCTLLLIVIAGTVSAVAQTESYDDVLLIVNDRSWASREIGKFFAERRGIPERHICHIDVDSSETMDSAVFVPLKWTLQSWMADRGLVDSVNYIVTTKGCPLRVRTSVWDHFDTVKSWLGGQASFEDCLALMNGADSTLMLSVKTESFPVSRYFGSKEHFRRDPVDLPMYLVTRLDAYTVDQVKSYLTRAEHPAVIGDGLWVMDIDPTKDGNKSYKPGNDWLRGAQTAIQGRGLNYLFNNDTLYIKNQQSVLGYASWGSNDAHSGGGEQSKPGNTWLDGSIAETYVSTSGRSFIPGAGYGQSLIADWIREGACGVKGYTDEPYLTAIAHPDILFDRYLSGFNLAESFFAASQYCAWRQVVIGDPKMKLGTMIVTSSPAIDFGQVPRYRANVDTLWIRNRMDVPVLLTSASLSGANAGEFHISQPGAFPVTLAPFDSIRIIVGFVATTYTARSAKLSLGYRRPADTSNLAMDVSLAGTGVRPTLEAPEVIDFGAVAPGDKADRTITVRNITFSDTVTVGSVALTGTGASRFSVLPAGTVSRDLPGDSTMTLTVTYQPTSQNADSAILKITGGFKGSPVMIRLIGNAATSSGVIALGDAEAGMALDAQPNPFTTATELTYVVPAGGAEVTIEVVDPLGRVAATLAEGGRAAGTYRTSIDGAPLPAGLYLCRMTMASGGGVISRVVPLVRR